MDADEAADQLYAVLPGQFVAARTALAAQTQADGDRSAAAVIRRLPKPSQPAWQVNLLVREHPGAVDELARVATALRSAAQSGAPDEVRRVNTQRQATVSRLADRAGQLALAAGKPTTAATRREVEATLQAALSSPAAAEQVASGRLVAALFDTGLDALGMLTLPRASEPGTGPVPHGRPAPHSAPGGAPSRSAAAEGLAALEAAAGALTDAEAEAGLAHRRAEQAAQEVAQLDTRLAAARRRMQTALDEAEAAAQRATEARTAHESARARYDALRDG